ncbi:MAG: hypothetical protein PHQ04_09500 [Opitutaceae bacterium]|nr:hypothetical protein [Opitutaceae bacterium]
MPKHPNRNLNMIYRKMMVMAVLTSLAVAFARGKGTDCPECVSWVNIGISESPEGRKVDVKPTYPADLFKSSLADIPLYQPGFRVTGTISVWGSDYVGSRLGDYWREGFHKYQPEATVENKLVNVLAAIPSITLGIGDMGLGRGASWAELFFFERVHNYPPQDILFAADGWDASLAVFVNSDNPISQLTIQQLDGIFGAQRTGAYVGTQWHPELARGPEKNIRTWGQLGLTGHWKDQPIRLHGSVINAFFMRNFERLVFGGEGASWNENFQQHESCYTADGKAFYRQDQVSCAVLRDPYAIGLAYRQFGDRPGLKLLRIAASENGPYVANNIQNVHNQSYPLPTFHHLYINRKPGQPIEPKVKEYVKFILSREGQEAITRHGKYLPLTADRVRAELAKLE